MLKINNSDNNNRKNSDSNNNKWTNFSNNVSDEPNVIDREFLIYLNTFIIEDDCSLNYESLEAVQQFKSSKFKEYLEKQANPNLIVDRESNSTILHCLVNFSHYCFPDEDENSSVLKNFNQEIVTSIKYLLEYNANPNLLNDKQNTPLHILLSKYDNDYFHLVSEIAQQLIEHGASPTIKNTENNSVIELLFANLLSDETYISDMQNDFTKNEQMQQLYLTITQTPQNKLELKNKELIETNAQLQFEADSLRIDAAALEQQLQTLQLTEQDSDETNIKRSPLHSPRI